MFHRTWRWVIGLFLFLSLNCEEWCEIVCWIGRIDLVESDPGSNRPDWPSRTVYLDQYKRKQWNKRTKLSIDTGGWSRWVEIESNRISLLIVQLMIWRIIWIDVCCHLFKFASFDPSDAMYEQTRRIISYEFLNYFLDVFGWWFHSTWSDSKDSTTPNDLSMSLSTSFTRRSTSSKKQRTPTNSQLDSFPTLNHASMVNATQSINTDLSSLNQTSSTMSMINDDSSGNTVQQRQQRKLDPRTCTECNKVLFNDKLLLLHGQTHAKNEKQCWICGIYDDDMKKHIISEHGNQKFSTTGFKVISRSFIFTIFLVFF